MLDALLGSIFYRAVETKPTGWYSNYCLKTKNIEVLKMNKVLLTAAITGAGDTIQKMKMFSYTTRTR